MEHIGTVYFKDGNTEMIISRSPDPMCLGLFYFETFAGEYAYQEECDFMELPLGDGRTMYHKIITNKFYKKTISPSGERIGYTPTDEIEKIELF